MKSYQVKQKETDELKQRYEDLQQYWDALKQSNPTKPSLKYSSPSNNPTNYTIKAIELENNSPRFLMSMLQQDTSEAWMEAIMTRSNGVASQEILQDRWEALENGKFKGRRLLLVPMEEESESDTSSDFEEVMSKSFCYSDDERESSESKENQHECCDSSSPCCFFGASVDKDRFLKRVEDMMATEAETRFVNRGRYAVLFLGLVGFLLFVAIFIMSGGRDYEINLVPT